MIYLLYDLLASCMAVSTLFSYWVCNKNEQTENLLLIKKGKQSDNIYMLDGDSLE